jgi:glyoxylase-like metal-dependent hydrolase (beta-lactamase superfamily II)
MKSALREIPPSPPIGGMVTLAPGLHWVRLPMPYELDHVNAWVIESDDGWRVVDTGLPTGKTMGIWEDLNSRHRFRGRLREVIVSHAHPDHVGLAGWLTGSWGGELRMSRGEYESARSLVCRSEAGPSAHDFAFYRQAGWNEGAANTYLRGFGNYGKDIVDLPRTCRWLSDGDKLSMAGHQWEVVTTSGHSPEHVSLYCPGLKLLISGDQVLPKITSNISVYPAKPEDDPLAGWAESLDLLQDRVPDDVLVLPAHNDCFYGLHRRIAELRRSYETTLARVESALGEPKRLVDFFGALYKRPIDVSDSLQLGLATGEALAYLNRLQSAGKAGRVICDGVAWYSSTRRASPASTSVH